jgi:imidazolonepropionase-like amidohydrolase
MNRIKLIILSILLSSTCVVAQYPLEPGPQQSQRILLKGGTAHLGNGNVIQNSIIGFDLGKLTVVGDAATTSINESAYQVIDISGKHVYPGFILPNTTLGLAEVGQLRHTRDLQERGALNPNVRSIISYNTDSEVIPTLRFNGILMAQVTPRGGRISGTSTVVQLDAWNWEDAVIKEDGGIHLNWPSRITSKFNFTTFTLDRQANKEYKKQVNELRTFFAEAKAYSQQGKKEYNLKMSAMAGLFEGTKSLFIHVNAAKEIIESISFAKESGIAKIALVGATQIMMVADFVKENNVAVITANIHRTPSYADEDIDLPYRLPYLLQQKGIKYAIGYSGRRPTSSESRNLPFSAGTAVAYGLTNKQALQAITKNTAEILGIDATCGTLESGKDATLFVSIGDALDMRTNQIELAYIQGRRLNLNGMQQALFEKYKTKYGHK